MRVLRNKLVQLYTCKVISGRQSALYGIRFSYPLYILLVTTGIVFEIILILLVAAFIALAGIFLPIHPFDYLYNTFFPRIFKTSKILGRGNELQVNSTISLAFSLLVTLLIVSEVNLNFKLMAFIYVACSIFFIVKQLKN